jgi:hypothetical protein
MDTSELLMLFLRRAKEDPRIGPVHLGLYLAIVYLWSEQGGGAFIQISARTLMPVAKIGGVKLYHRSVRQLHDYGYLRYEPSYDPELPSRIYLYSGRETLSPALKADRGLPP